MNTTNDINTNTIIDINNDIKSSIDNSINQFLMINREYFRPEDLIIIKSKLLDSKMNINNLTYSVKFINPTTTFIISLFLGHLGIDRFMIGDVKLGMLKLFLFIPIIPFIFATLATILQSNAVLMLFYASISFMPFMWLFAFAFWLFDVCTIKNSVKLKNAELLNKYTL